MLRGLDKVHIEWGLLSFAFNIKKMHKKDIKKLKEIANEMAISEINGYIQKFQRFLTGIFASWFIF